MSLLFVHINSTFSWFSNIKMKRLKVKCKWSIHQNVCLSELWNFTLPAECWYWNFPSWCLSKYVLLVGLILASKLWCENSDFKELFKAAALLLWITTETTKSNFDTNILFTHKGTTRWKCPLAIKQMQKAKGKINNTNLIKMPLQNSKIQKWF